MIPKSNHDPLWSHTETMGALHAARALVPQALDQVRQLLYAIHGVDYSSEFLLLVHGFWAEHLCHDVVFHARSETEVNHTSQSAKVFVVPKSKPKYPQSVTTALSRGDVIRGLATSSLNTQDISLVMERDPYGAMSLRSRLRGVTERLVRNDKASIWICHPYTFETPLRRAQTALRTRETMVWSDDVSIRELEASLNESLRKSLAGSMSVVSHETLVRALVPLVIPTDLAEDLQQLENQVRSQPQRPLRLMYTANAQHYHLQFKIAAAFAKQTGVKLLVHQHGGGYGIDEMHAGEFYDRAIADRFYTFGWTDEANSTNVTPLVAPVRGVRQSDSHNFLLISVDYTKEFFRFQSFCMPGHAEACLNETKLFLGELHESTTIHLRLSPELPLPIKELESARCQVVQTHPSRSGSELAAHSRLVIHNYLGTSWLETLAMNIPTVCFYDPVMYRPRAAAQPFVDALAKVGVIHYSGIEAAKFVNGLNGDPSAWWQSAEVQEAREAFVARYANFSENWLPAWIEEFERLLAE